ncbi:DJ-1/PfpI family protein [Novosphingobium soli]|uniref:DJ-1/PfpI family protein n=1 Tax=Novosphingobium soli TaxID=574956 RepID=A0ABV6CWV3_9SPHN
MQIAVLTFEGFNELDSFVAASILNRMRSRGWAAYITAPAERVTSMNGVTVERQRPMSFAAEADAVLIGSGMRTRDVAADPALMAQITLDPTRQLIGAQCSGTLLLAKLGLLGDLPACTDLTSKPWAVEAGANIVDAPFAAHGNVATAGGCLASQYLATWLIARGASLGAAEEAARDSSPARKSNRHPDARPAGGAPPPASDRASMHYVAPVGEKALYVERALGIVAPFLTAEAALVP